MIVLNFCPAFLLTPQQSQKAHTLLHIFTQDYGLDQSIQRGYRFAKLIEEMFELVTSKDTFLGFFFSYIYESLNADGKLGMLILGLCCLISSPSLETEI